MRSTSAPESAPTLDEAFERQAERTPSAVALVDEHRSITFAELNAAADRVAASLAANGISHGFVGLHVERSIDYVAGLLGILKSASAVVPLPPSYPKSRLREILDFAQLDAVIDGSDARLDEGSGVRVVRVTSDSPPLPRAARAVSDADRPAYVLSSSGSTGKPKLIVRSHRSFFHRLRWTWGEHPFGADAACVQKSHMTTTHAIYELFEPMLQSVPLHIVPDSEVRQLGLFWEGLRRRGVSRLLIVPSMLRASLDIPSFVPPPLELVVLMGEHVPATLAERVVDAFPAPARIYSIYGSTEASSTLVCDVRAALRPGEELPLGRPISTDVRAVVLDNRLAPVARGEAGMLYISGTPLFSEYYRDPTLTTAAIVDRDGERLYRTQDRVRVLADGALSFVGRVDDTVKVRGFRVDLRDVERAVASHAGVTQSTVLAIDGEAGAQLLVAFVTPASVAAADVLRVTREALPPYMVPSTVVSLDAFPLTASGKVDRRALVAAYEARSGAAPSNSFSGASAFASATERLIAQVWEGVLGHARFGRGSSFFEIGGSSLDVAVAVHRTAMALGLDGATLVELTMYQHPTLAALAAHVDAVREGRTPAAPTADAVLVTLKRGADAALAPLFLISSAGGTLGAYTKLASLLTTRREVIGVRDPFLWGDRDPTLGFSHWVSRFVDAIRGRQARGPYHIAAYSSAGAFGFEIARRLRDAGEEVALVALIDPLALDRATKKRFGYWALEARFQRRPVTWALRFAGFARLLAPVRTSRDASDWAPSRDAFDALSAGARRNPAFIRALSALLELNSGLPVSLGADEVAAAGPDGCLQLLFDRMRSVAPETNVDMIERLVVQYELQVRSQHNYRLQPFDGTVHLFEPDGPYRGLESAQLRPYVKRLRARGIAVGGDTRNARLLEGLFPERIVNHYLCMRDDQFVARLGAELDSLLAG